MDIKKLEEQLRKSADDHREEVDITKLWGDVSTELHQKKRRRSVFWIFFGVVSVAILGVGLWSMVSSDLSDHPEASLLSSKDSQPTLEEILIELADLRPKEDATSPVPVGAIDANYTALSRVETYDMSGVSHRGVSSLGSGGTQIRKFNEKSEVSAGEDYKKSDLQMIPPEARISTPIKVSNESNINVNEILDKSEIGHPTAISILSLRLLPIVYPAMIQPQRHKSFFEGAKKWSLGISGSLYSNNVNIEPSSSEVPSTSYEIRSVAMSPLTSWGMAVRLGYQLSDELTITSGLRLHQFYSGSTNELTSSEEIILDGVVVEQVMGPDGTTDILGEAIVTQVTQSVRTRIARFSTVSIPIGLEYSFLSAGFQPYVGVGLDYSFSINNRGLIHLSDNREYDISTDPEPWLSRSLGLSGALTIGGKLPLADYISVSAVLGYRKEFFSRFNQTSGITESYQSLQLGMGVEFRF